MDGCIICGFDDTSGSRNAASVAARLARDLGSDAVLVNVLPREGLLGRLPARMLGRGRRAHHVLRVAAEEHCFPEHTSVRVRAGDPARTMIAAARQDDAALIVIGSGGRATATSRLIGGVASELIRDAPCPFVVVPRDAIPPLDSAGMRGVVCGAAGHDEDGGALELATALAQRLGGPLHEVPASEAEAIELDRIAEHHGAGLIVAGPRVAVALTTRGRTPVVVPAATGVVGSRRPGHAESPSSRRPARS